ncbi:MAG: DNA primase [Planctomycetes bacterium]|nr:DNA primase [Planctomycetota bacterium]
MDANDFETVKQRIKDAIDLVDLVQEDTPLTRRGRTFVALCPFHKERTPSFTVYPDTQHYKCYGCGVSGDVLTFVMEREGVSFREAMEMLGERAGVSTEGVFGRGRGGAGSRQRAIHEVLEQVRELFEATLHDERVGAQARSYLEQRGLLDAAREFGLGLHPAPGRLAAFARQRKLPLEVLEQAGLLAGDGAEPMRGRLMFPIVDERGRPVGFGGRILPDPRIPKGEDRRPKYRNSPESPFFNKRRLLYGLREVKRAGTRRIVVVEGYTDVIALHLAGFTGAVATLGTALTADHGRLLERYATEGVVLLFDGDAAGRRAADRAFRELVHTPLSVRIALLPDGIDPADLVAIEPTRTAAERDAGRERLAELIEAAEDAVAAWFRILRRDVDLTDDAQVQRVAAECGRILAGVDNRARAEALRAAMAARLGLSPAAIEIPAAPRRAAAAEPEPVRPTARRPVAPTKHEQADLDALACLLAAPELGERLRELPGETAAWLDRFLGWIEQGLAAGRRSRDVIVPWLFGRCEDDADARAVLAEAVDRSARIRDPRQVFAMVEAGRVRQAARQEARRMRALVQQALADGDAARADELTRKYQEVLRRSGAAGAGNP